MRGWDALPFITGKIEKKWEPGGIRLRFVCIANGADDLEVIGYQKLRFVKTGVPIHVHPYTLSHNCHQQHVAKVSLCIKSHLVVLP